MRDEPPRPCAWEAIVVSACLQCTNNDCIKRGINSLLFIYLKQFKLSIERKKSTINTTRDSDSRTQVSVSFVSILFSRL